MPDFFLDEIETRAELLLRRYDAGSTITNCVVHMSRDITDRPTDCRLCQADVRNTLARALRANEWLNTWKDDATAHLQTLPIGDVDEAA